MMSGGEKPFTKMTFDKNYFFPAINRTTAKSVVATSPTLTRPHSGWDIVFLYFFISVFCNFWYFCIFSTTHRPSGGQTLSSFLLLLDNTLLLLRKHMKVHGKDAVCQFDSSESDDEEESSAASPSSSLVSAPPSYLRGDSVNLRGPSPASSHGPGAPVSQPDWY